MHIFVHPRRGGERGRGGEQSRSKGNEWRAVMVSTSISLSHISFLLTSSSRCSGKGRSAYSKHLLWRHWPESEPISRPLGWRLVSIFSSETQALSRSRVSRVSRHDDFLDDKKQVTLRRSEHPKSPSPVPRPRPLPAADNRFLPDTRHYLSRGERNREPQGSYFISPPPPHSFRPFLGSFYRGGGPTSQLGRAAIGEEPSESPRSG